MRLVIDSNVIISAYTTDGDVRTLWQQGLELQTLLISPEIFSEIERNLRRTEFGLQPEEVRMVLSDILKRCEVIRMSSSPIDYEGDAHLAVLESDARADFIVTGDHALLDRGKIGETQTISPGELASKLQESPDDILQH